MAVEINFSALMRWLLEERGGMVFVDGKLPIVIWWPSMIV